MTELTGCLGVADFRIPLLMAPRRGGRRRRNGNRRFRGGLQLAYEFTLIYNPTAPGPQVREISYGELGVDASRPLRPVRASVNMATEAGCVSVSLAMHGAPGPTTTGAIVNRSAIRTVSVATQTVALTAPRVTDFFTVAANNALLAINFHLVQPRDGKNSLHVMLSGTVWVQFQARDVPAVLK